MTRTPPRMFEGPEGHTPLPARAPRQIPYVCWALIAACVAMFFADSALMGTVVMPDGQRFRLQALALYGPLVQQGQYWRILGCVLEHGGALHLLFNMSVVYTLGFTLETSIRSWRFFLVSLITAAGSASFALFFQFDVPTVGASGMILGWAGVMLPVATEQGRKQLGTWLLQVAILSLLPGISWAGHLGGFVFGLPCGLALRQGPVFFKRAIPVLLFLAAVVALMAAHPERMASLGEG